MKSLMGFRCWSLDVYIFNDIYVMMLSVDWYVVTKIARKRYTSHWSELDKLQVGIQSRLSTEARL